MPGGRSGPRSPDGWASALNPVYISVTSGAQVTDITFGANFSAETFFFHTKLVTISPSAREQDGRGRSEPPSLLVSYSLATLRQAAQKMAGGTENLVDILACGFPSVCDS